jgi:EmrB/QacA subfamily drug resistance transporter
MFRTRSTSVATAAILALQFMFALDSQVMTVALPTIQGELGFSAASLSWIPNAYAIAFGGLILLGSRLGDRFGRVRLFAIGAGLFALASLIGGLAPNAGVLIAARVLQGVGAAVAAPSVLALISTMATSRASRARGLALFTVMSAVGASFGLILGGVLTDLASWRWGLLVNVPIGIIVITIVLRLVPNQIHPQAGRFDVLGALLATLASVAVVWAFLNTADHGWTDLGTLASFVAAAVLILLLVLVERRAASPVIAVHLLKDLARTGALLSMGLTSGAHLAMLFMIALYLQRTLQFSPLLAGLAFLPLTVSVFVITRWVPQWVAKFGTRTVLVAGGVLVTLSFVLWSTLGVSSTYLEVVVPLLVHAAGVSLIFTAGTIAAMDKANESDAGSASGMLQMAQQIGGALGIAVVVSVYAANATPGQFVPGLQVALLAGGGLAVLGAVIALVTVRRRPAPPTNSGSIATQRSIVESRPDVSGNG